jgi:hypothetical protein
MRARMDERRRESSFMTTVCVCARLPGLHALLQPRMRSCRKSMCMPTWMYLCLASWTRSSQRAGPRQMRPPSRHGWTACELRRRARSATHSRNLVAISVLFCSFRHAGVCANALQRNSKHKPGPAAANLAGASIKAHIKNVGQSCVLCVCVCVFFVLLLFVCVCVFFFV